MSFSLASYSQFCIKDKSTISVILVRIIVCKSPSLLTSGRVYLVVCTYSFWCVLGYVWLCYYVKEDDSDVWMLLRKLSVLLEFKDLEVLCTLCFLNYLLFGGNGIFALLKVCESVIELKASFCAFYLNLEQWFWEGWFL